LENVFVQAGRRLFAPKNCWVNECIKRLINIKFEIDTSMVIWIRNMILHIQWKDLGGVALDGKSNICYAFILYRKFLEWSHSKKIEIILSAW
jgi:hypothetical protein